MYQKNSSIKNILALIVSMLIFGMALQFLQNLGIPIKFVRNQFMHGNWWQPITAQWIHLNGKHALVNAWAAILLICLTVQLNLYAEVLFATVGAMAAVALLLMIDTSCSIYAGASGFLHGTFSGIMLGALFQRASRVIKFIGAIGLILLIIKLITEHYRTNHSNTWLGITIYSASHLTGTIGGIFGFGFWHLLSRCRVNKSPYQ
jgi:membrane associated rhomboid family serine protease